MIPKKVNVFGLEIDVEEVFPCLDSDGNRVDGTYEPDANIICIDKSLSKEKKQHTLIHEMGHAMFFRCSISQTEVDPQVEEIIVNNNATLMTEIFNLRFKRNK